MISMAVLITHGTPLKMFHDSRCGAQDVRSPRSVHHDPFILPVSSHKVMIRQEHSQAELQFSDTAAGVCLKPCPFSSFI